MKEDKDIISIEQIFDAVRKCRCGDLSEGVAETLIAAELLRGVMHIGSAPPMRIVFACAVKGRVNEAETHLVQSLPPQASLRYTTTFGVDFIVSGQLPDTWAEDQIAKKADLFEDLYEAEVSPVKRYRWALLRKSPNSRSQAKGKPSLEDVEKFLTDPKQVTRLVYDSTKLPSLSCLALITPAEGRNLRDIWEELEENDQQVVRDLFTNHGDKARLSTNAMDPIIRATGYAFCEFDSIGGTGNGSFIPAMNQAYKWRSRMMNQKYVQLVRMIPCAVMVESTDLYDEIDEVNDRMERFKPTVLLPYDNRQVNAKESQISFPIWNVAICGGSGSGKSVFAYVLASALLKEHQYDVVYVNYKNSDDIETLGPQPRNEALEFGKILEHIAQTDINLVVPEALENSITSQKRDKPAAWYTECAKAVRAESILKAVFASQEKRFRNSPRGMFVVFDEILNQKKNLDQDMGSLMAFVNQKRTSNIFLGIIHQDLTGFWANEAASTFLERSTVVLGSSLSANDEDRYKWLSARAGSISPPISPVNFAEVIRYQKFEGKFVFLPNKEGNSEHGLRHRLPDYPFLKVREPVPQDWKWGSTVGPRRFS